MGRCSKRAKFGVFFILLTFFLAVFQPTDAEAKKKRGGKARRGAAGKVAAKKKGGGKRRAGRGGRRNVARNGVGRNAGVALDENNVFNGELDGRGGRFRRVFVNGQPLDIAQDEFGNTFGVREGIPSDGGVLDPSSLASASPLVSVRGGRQFIPGVDSSGRSLPGNVVQSIQLFNSGGSSDTPF